MSKEEKIPSYPNSIDTRVALLEQSINNINNTLMRFEKRFDSLESEGRSHHRWNMGLLFGLYTVTISSLLTVIIKFFH